MTILTTIAAIGTIIGGLVYLVKRFFPPKTSAEKDDDIEKEVEDEKHAVDQGDRPRW